MGRLYSILLIIFVAGCASSQDRQNVESGASTSRAEIGINQLWFEIDDVEAFKGWEGLKVALGKKSNGPDAIIAEIEKGHQHGFPDKFEYVGLLFRLASRYRFEGDYQKALHVLGTIENTPIEGVSFEAKWFLVYWEKWQILTKLNIFDRPSPLSDEERDLGERLLNASDNLLSVLGPKSEVYSQVAGIRSFKKYVISQHICNLDKALKGNLFDWWDQTDREFQEAQKEKLKGLLRSEFGMTQEELADADFCSHPPTVLSFSWEFNPSP